MGDAARYRVLSELGEGGMGAVRLVHDGARQEDVAQKRVCFPSPSALMRFKREFRAVERLVHPNLVRVYELGEDEEGPYFTMEAIDGVDLGRFCVRGGGDGGSASNDPLSGTRTKARGTAGDAETLAATLAPIDAAPTDAAPDLGCAPTLDASGEPGVTSTRPAGVRAPIDLRAVERRIAHAFPQILEGLSFLHAHGIVHRDLKPANVMVDVSGTVKLLDFGILATRDEPAAEERGRVIGTLGFIAPEQLRGADAEPASDVYALGVMLHELLCGQPVFEGEPARLMLAHLADAPPRLVDRVPEVSPALARAADECLRKNPAERPSLAELGRLLVEAGARTPVLERPRTRLAEVVGHDALAQRLASLVAETTAGAFRFVVARGPSGSGKTTLVEHALDAAARSGALVLRGRGRANDRLAFNAIDGCIDQLTTALGRRRKRDEQIRSAATAASLTFPVLAEMGDGTAGATRAIAFDGVVSLLSSLAGEAGVVLSIDDLQWADRDSLALLEHLLDAAPSRVVIVSTLRDDVPPGPPAALVERRRDGTILDVGGLDERSLAIIAERAARALGAEPSDAQLLHAAKLADGRPFLAELAGRALAHGGAGDALLAPLVRTGVERDASLLALVVAADDWTAVGDLARLLDRGVGEVDDRVRELANEGLLRRAGMVGAEGTLDAYHDTVRGELARQLPPDALTRAHGRLADHLLARDDARIAPARLVRHLVGGDRAREAVVFARRAAALAEAQMAHSLAADMHAVAVAHGDESDARAARTPLAEALERAGRYPEAAEVWDTLARDASGADAAHLAMKSAHAMLASNRVAEGAERLNAALARVGDPPIGSPGIRGYLAGLGFLWGPPRARVRARGEPDRERLERAHADVRIGLMVGYFDPIAGARVMRRARAAYADLGAAEQVAWCDFMFAVFAENGSSSPHRPRLVASYRASAERTCEEHGISTPRIEAARAFLEGEDALRRVDWDAALDAFERTLAQLGTAGLVRVFEYSYALSQVGVVHVLRQNLAGVEATLLRHRAFLRTAGDAAIVTHSHLLGTMAETMRGRFDEACALVDAARDALPVEIPTIQRAVTNVVGLYPRLYFGDPSAGLATLTDGGLAVARQFRLFSTNVGGMYAVLVAQTEVTALRSGVAGGSARRATKYARMAQAAAPTAAGDPERVLAYLADDAGHPERALALLEDSAAAAERHARPLSLAIARYQRGIRLGGDEGAALVAAARASAAELGVAEALLEEDPAHR